MYPIYYLSYMGNKDVIWFDVSMNDASLVKIYHCPCNFVQNSSYTIDLRNLCSHALVDSGFCGALLRHTLQNLGTKFMAKGLTLHELHKEVEMRTFDCGAETFNNVGVTAHLMELVLADHIWKQ